MDLFGAMVRGARDRALTFPDRTLSYADLRVHAVRTWRAMAPLPRVAVLAEPRIETAVAIVGALLGGVEAVPLNPRSGTSELAHIRDDARPGAVLAAPGAELPAALADLPLIIVDLDAGVDADDDGARGLDTRAEPQLAPDSPALIVYTSGTTGPPKGAVLPRRAIASNLDALAQAWAWTGDDVVAHALPLFHVHGLVLGILGPLRRGGRAMHLGRFSPQAVTSALAGEATMLFGVPTMYRRLADAAESSPELAAALARARLLVSGSAALPAAEHARLRWLTGREVIERYGMTETLMNTAMRAGAAVTPGTVGPPLPGIEVRLVDDDGADIPDTAAGGAGAEPPIGEVHVRGPNLFLGYLNRPDATGAAMRDGGWFATGDMAVRESDGAIRLVGRRATDLIKSGGYKIGAGEIEAALREHAAVADAAVTGEPDDDLGERVAAWVVLADGAQTDEPALVDHVATTLAPHKRPRVVRFVAELPRNELGKVQKKRLSELTPRPPRFAG